MLTVIDMKIGNLQSVLQALERVGAPPVTVTNRAQDIERASAILLPGVGAFADGMASLRQNGLVEPLRRRASDGTPMLGICLGMQLLAERSEEHGAQLGLGVVPGSVVHLQPPDSRCRVPNMGWCDVTVTRSGSVLFQDLRETRAFYFAHSYSLECADSRFVAATLDYGGTSLTAAIEHQNLFGVQFHPEKSQDAGLTVLSSFITYARALARA